jgi:hypothetical protein
VAFEPTIPVFEHANTFNAIEVATPMIGMKFNEEWMFSALSPDGDNSVVIYPRENDFHSRLNKKPSVLRIAMKSVILIPVKNSGSSVSTGKGFKW